MKGRKAWNDLSQTTKRHVEEEEEEEEEEEKLYLVTMSSNRDELT